MISIVGFPGCIQEKSVGKQGNIGAGGTGNGRRHEVKYEGTLQLWVKSVFRDITSCTSIWMEIFFDRGQEEDLYCRFPRLHPRKEHRKVGKYHCWGNRQRSQT